MAGNKGGVTKTAAKRCGLSIEAYEQRIAEGQKHCWGCKLWKPSFAFGIDRSRYDGLNSKCIACRRPKIPTGKAAMKVGVKMQARGAVNYAVSKGHLASPKSLKCMDCDKQAREYDHHRGYERSHWLDVQPVCSSCHKRRTYRR